MAVLESANWRRIFLGKVWRPYSFPVSDPVWSAEWKTRGFAIERRIVRHRGELGAIAPTRKGFTSPPRTEPGQNARVRLCLIVMVLFAETHLISATLSVRGGRSQGSGRWPPWSSPGVLRRRAWSHGAWPCGVVPVRISDPWRGRSVGVGTLSVCSSESSVKRAA